MRSAPRACWVLALGWGLGLLVLAPPLAAADAPAQPRVLVPPVVGVSREAALASHGRLVQAMRARFGDRVVDGADVIEAQKRARVWPNQLLTGAGVARLAKEVQAERAVVVSATQGGVSVLVFAVPGQEATRAIPLRGVRAERLSAKEAKRIARAVEQKARVLLEYDARPVVAIDVGAVEVGAEAWDEQAAPAAPPIASDEIREEERREAEALAARQQARVRVPSLWLATGLALGSRQVELGGSQARRVIPVESGALPCWSVSASLEPLRWIPPLHGSPLAGLVLDVSYRRGLYSADYQGTELRVDDDDLTLRGSYRLPLWRHPAAPWLGVGGGGGWQRSEIGCCLPAPSTRYVFAELHGRVLQPLWRPWLTAEGVLAVRQPLGGDGTLVLAPASQAELWLNLRVAPIFFARAGLRTAQWGLWQASRLTLDERLTTLGFEIGGYF